MNTEHCVVIGASHSAAALSAQLRKGGWQGAITLVGDEAALPYHRPPLSKAFLSGEKSAEHLSIRPASFFEKADIGLKLGTRVLHIDSERRLLALGNGEELSYSRLALTTGAKPRRLPIPGEDLDGVFYLRNLGDAAGIRERAVSGGSAVIVGGGYIGLETAASLRRLGMRVAVLEAMSRVLQRVTAEEISAFYTRVHEEEGVEVLTDAQVAAILGEGRVSGVRLANGDSLDADLVLIGVGVVPDTELAEGAGLAVDNGIQVDEYAQTSDEHIVAAGDCTRHFNGIYRRWVRLESVQNATEQARTAANTLNGNLEPYRSLPWFWSDQYDLKLQIAGLSQGYDRLVLRGDPKAGRDFSAFYFHGDQLLAIDSVNRPKDYMATRRALEAGMRADPERLADDGADISDAFSS